MVESQFGTVMTAMVTAFDKNLAVDVAETVRLAAWLVEQGNHALVVTGTTGEAPTLSDGEKATVWREVAAAVPVPIIAGAGSNDTRHSVEMVERATRSGAAGILAVTPYYNRPSQEGIRLHFAAIANATDLPVILYDIPIRTGRKIAHETLLRLVNDHDNIVGVKDAAGDVKATKKLLKEAPDDFQLFSGEDSLTLDLLKVGACGVIGVASHWAAPEFAEMLSTFSKGDAERAEEVNALLAESFAFETGDESPNPVPAKAMMRTLGFAVGECRLPMGPTPDGLENRGREVFAALEARRAS